MCLWAGTLNGNEYRLVSSLQRPTRELAKCLSFTERRKNVAFQFKEYICYVTNMVAVTPICGDNDRSCGNACQNVTIKRSQRAVGSEA